MWRKLRQWSFAPARTMGAQIPRALVASVFAAALDFAVLVLLVEQARWHPLPAAVLSYLIGGVLQGPATDLGIEAAHMLRLRDRLYKLMADFTGKTPEVIHRDFDRNKWLFAEESVEYGCADNVLLRAPEVAARTRRDIDAQDEKE